MIYTNLSSECTGEAVALLFAGVREGVGDMEFDRAGFDRDVGLRLQRTRKERGITQEELAKRLGLPRPSYANIESGRQRVPLDVVWRAAVVLDVSIAALVPEPLSRRREPALTNTMAFGTATVPTESMGFLPWRNLPEDSAT
jgi:transcriptional regulator with XRE-family HTH domain